jgi:hypothetical protein
MRTCLIGIVSRFGLESLMPETDATRRWLLQATCRHPVVCVWADVQRTTAAEIFELLAEGDSRVALRHMTNSADRVGPLSL